MESGAKKWFYGYSCSPPTRECATLEVGPKKKNASDVRSAIMK